MTDLTISDINEDIDEDHDIFALSEKKHLIGKKILDENQNPELSDFEDIYLDKDINEGKDFGPQKSNCITFLSKMATIRGYLQARKQYLPTALLLICVTIYLPYSYVSVLHARSEHMNEIRTSSGFQKVANRTHRLFSAYLDDRFPREPAKLRILGIKNKKDDHPLFCKLYYDDRTALCLPNPAIEVRLDPKDKYHTVDTQSLFHCTLPEKPAKVPVGVTLTSSRSCQSLDHIVPIQAVQGDPTLKKDIAVCFCSPSTETDHRNLVEILELSRLFGASVVQIYNDSMEENLLEALKPYVDSGFLSILPWNLGDRYLPSMAQALSINDCIYRNAAQFKNVVFVDKDEIILPSASYKSSWATLINKMRQIHPSAGAFWFEEGMYVTETALKSNVKVEALPKSCPLSSLPKNQLPRIFTHRFLARQPDIKDRHAQYTQAIVDPSGVLYMDTDKRIVFLPGKSSSLLPLEAGQCVHFTDFTTVKDFDKLEALETFRSKYNIQLTKAIYNKLNGGNKVDLSGCTD